MEVCGAADTCAKDEGSSFSLAGPPGPAVFLRDLDSDRRATRVVELSMPRLGGAYCFRRVRSQRKSVDWGTMESALGGAYELCGSLVSACLSIKSLDIQFCDI